MIKVKAKYPYTTVGMPANTSRIGLNDLPGAVASVFAQIDAMPMPDGTATINATAATNIVPATSGSTPYARGFRMGDQRVPVMNSKTDTWRKKPTDSTTRVTTIATVVTMETIAHDRKTK